MPLSRWRNKTMPPRPDPTPVLFPRPAGCRQTLSNAKQPLTSPRPNGLREHTIVVRDVEGPVPARRTCAPCFPGYPPCPPPSTTACRLNPRAPLDAVLQRRFEPTPHRSGRTRFNNQPRVCALSSVAQRRAIPLGGLSYHSNVPQIIWRRVGGAPSPRAADRPLWALPVRKALRSGVCCPAG